MKKNFSFSLLSNIFSSICKFLILIIIIKIGTPIEVGKYNYALALCAPIFILSSLKIRSIQITNNKFRYNDYNNLSFITNFTMLFVLVFIVSIFYDKENLYTIFFVAFIKVIDNLREVVYGRFHRDENLEFISKSTVYNNAACLLLFGILYILTHSLNISLFGMLLGNLLAYIFYDVRNLLKNYPIKLKFTFKKELFTKLFLMALPLSFSSSIGSFNISMPRFFLMHFNGEYFLGIFSAIAYILVIANLFASSISQVFLPRLSKLYREEKFVELNVYARRLIKIGFMIGFIFVFFSIVFGKELLLIVFGTEYSSYSAVLIILSIGLMFLLSGVFVGTVLTSLGNYSVHYKISIVTLLSSTILSILLIPRYSIYGAGLTVTLSQFVTMIGYYYYFKKLKLGELK